MDTVAALLARVGLGSYAAKMDELGYDDIAFLLTMEDDECLLMIEREQLQCTSVLTRHSVLAPQGPADFH